MGRENSEINARMSDDEFAEPSGANNRWNTTNANKILNPSQGGVFRWKRLPPSNIPDTNEANGKRQKVGAVQEVEDHASDIIELSDDESEIHITDDSADGSPKKEKPITNDAPAPITVYDSPTKINDALNNPVKNSPMKGAPPMRVGSNYDDVPLPPGMPPMIAGLPVKFPVTPYKSQISVMNSVSKFYSSKVIH